MSNKTLLRYLYNNTGVDIVINGDDGYSITFPSLANTQVFRNYAYHSNELAIGKTSNYLNSGELIGRDFSNINLTAQQCNEVLSTLLTQTNNGDWNELASLDLLIGMRHLLDTYDFTGVSCSRAETIEKLVYVLSSLHWQWLTDATEALQCVALLPDPAPNFLTVGRINAMIEAFQSAEKP